MEDGPSVLPHTLTLDHVSPATRLLEKRRQMFEVQEALDAQKEEFARREETFRRREEGLRKKDLDLQESLIRFNRFLQENESKRTRAEKRASDERRFREEKEEQVKALTKELEKVKAESAQLELELSKHKRFQEYLEKVMEAHGEDYPEIGHILHRYKTLKEADETLDAQQRDTEKQMEMQRAGANSLRKAKVDDFFISNNQVANLKKKLKDTERKTVDMQTQVDVARRILREQTKELGQVLLAVENLKMRCTVNRLSKDKGPTIKHGRADEIDSGPGNSQQSSEEKSAADAVSTFMDDQGRKAMEDLDIIQAYILDFKDIVDQAKREPAEAYEQAASATPDVMAASAPVAAPAPTTSTVARPSSPQSSRAGTSSATISRA